MFDADGYYRTGDVVAEVGPDQLVYLDRRNNVLKLSQGEFVTVVEAGGGVRRQPAGPADLRLRQQRTLLPAGRRRAHRRRAGRGGDVESLKPPISESLQDIAKDAGLQSYEIPRDFIIETTPFTLENGLLTGIRKLARPKLKEHYGDRLEQLYTELADSQANELRALRQSGADRPVLETISRAAGALLGAAAGDLAARRALHRSRRGFVVGVDIRQSAARDLRRRRAGRRHRQPGQRSAVHRRLHRDRAHAGIEAAHVRHGPRPRRHRGARP